MTEKDGYGYMDQLTVTDCIAEFFLVCNRPIIRSKYQIGIFLTATLDITSFLLPSYKWQKDFECDASSAFQKKLGWNTMNKNGIRQHIQFKLFLFIYFCLFVNMVVVKRGFFNINDFLYLLNNIAEMTCCHTEHQNIEVNKY